MIILKIIFCGLIMAPLLYLGLFLFEKLVDSATRK